jgi:hypothetical protein
VLQTFHLAITTHEALFWVKYFASSLRKIYINTTIKNKLNIVKLSGFKEKEQKIKSRKAIEISHVFSINAKNLFAQFISLIPLLRQCDHSTGFTTRQNAALTERTSQAIVFNASFRCKSFLSTPGGVLHSPLAN